MKQDMLHKISMEYNQWLYDCGREKEVLDWGTFEKICFLTEKYIVKQITKNKAENNKYMYDLGIIYEG